MSLLLLIFILLAGGGLAWLSARYNPDYARWVSLLTIAVALTHLVTTITQLPADALLAIPATDEGSSWLIHYRSDWIPRFGISVEVAMDGLSLLLVVLTLTLGFVAVISSWSETSFSHGFFQANLLWTLAGVVGVFVAMDMLLFFLFWEVMLIPMYLLIAIWGHERKAYAAMKFFIFTQVSGLLLLLSIVILAYQGQQTSGTWSFSYFELLGVHPSAAFSMPVMLGFFIAFTVKLPGFPFHTWLPDAHTQAPTAGSVILAGILLKTGAYGLLRFAIPLFPEASALFTPVALTLGAIGIIYGAILAFAQDDFKRLVAYSSVSHMGFVLLGLYAWNHLAIQGAIMQMVAHGVSTAALFMMAGALQQRLHTRDMRKMGGLWHQAPLMGACAMFFAVASLGLPGLGNFVAEFLVLLGLFKVNPIMAAIAALGMITAAIYALQLVGRSFQGQADESRQMKDFGAMEMATMGVMIVALLWLGLYPQPVLDLAQPVLDGLANSTNLALAPTGSAP